MPIIFDQVSAEIDTPRGLAQEDSSDASAAPRHEAAASENLLRALEVERERERRLIAD
ncbi:hypothetical protein [Methylotetracoccus oryzae]|uniref:hypothetical protein n=1 Tax=Methylotetracoccus oryzae TaxID=1919059 RepID=UPI0013A549CF|nr:hypothetical protein [Methylotetracoccus oryzae]